MNSDPRKKRQERWSRYEQTARNGGIAPAGSHGASTYRNWGCKCATCKTGNTKYVARQRAKRRLAQLSGVV